MAMSRENFDAFWHVDLKKVIPCRWRPNQRPIATQNRPWAFCGTAKEGDRQSLDRQTRQILFTNNDCGPFGERFGRVN